MVRSREGQLLAVVGEDLRVVCAARDGNVGHAVIEQVLGPQFGIRVDQHSVGGLPLAGMTRQRVCVQTADFSAVANFPVYDAWDVRICPRPALIWFEFPSQLSVLERLMKSLGAKRANIGIPEFSALKAYTSNTR